MSKFELMTLKSGVMSLRSTENKETFHPVTGPRVEANLLYVQQQQLVERARACSGKFIIWDVGFGAGANAVAAIEALLAAHSTFPSECEIELHSFDKTLEPIEFALEHTEALDYLLPHQELLATLLATRQIALKPNFSWLLHLSDFGEEVKAMKYPAPHAILYDPYSSTMNQEMWNLEHFTRLFNCLDPAVPCLLTNYTRSTAVRVTLLLAGFYVGVGEGVGEKSETTIASNDLTLLNHPLDQRWLERVRASRNSAPLRTSPYTQAPISPEDLVRVEAVVREMTTDVARR